MKKSMYQKLLCLACAFVICVPIVLADAVSSGELFATYQKFGDTFYEGSGETDLSATSHDWAINYYVVSCGDSIWLRATTTESNNLEAGWQTQLRVWNASGTYDTQRSEVQTNVTDNKNCYTSIGRTFTAKSANDLKMHFFVNWSGNCSAAPFDFNRSSINNPIVDNTAPVIDPDEVTMTEVGEVLVFTFGDVTASEEYFYYVADNDHHVGNVSLTNKVYITKPTVEDGTTYTFKCYAVDYNGNKSDYKAFTLTMDFDPEVDLARGKSCTAGAVQNDNTADKAVDGNSGTFWTCFGETSGWWWTVDIGNVYDLSQIQIEFNDIWEAYSIYASANNSDWTAIVEGATASGGETKTYLSLTESARYLKVTSAGSHIGIKEFKVYATGVSSLDNTDPTLSVSCTAKTVTSATLQIVAADKDDADNDGTITSIKVSDTSNGFAEIEVLNDLDGDNKIILSDLTDNTTYNFTVTAYDRAGNHTSESVEVVLPFNTELNLALNKECTGGYCQFSDHTPAGDAAQHVKANDGNTGTSYSAYGAPSTDDAWWQVNLGAVYNVAEVKVVWASDYSTGYALYGSLDGTNCYLIGKDEATASGAKSTTVAAPAQYIKVHSYNKANIVINEVEVYASGFSTLADSKPVITYAQVVDVEDTSVEIEVGGVDVTTAPVTWQISGLGGSPVVKSATNNIITLDGLTSNTNYNITLYAKDGSSNLSDGTALAFKTSGSAAGLYLFSDYFGWGDKDQARAQFSTTAEDGVLSLTIANMTAGNHNFKLYNGTDNRCTKGDCGGGSDHHIYNASAMDVTFYATSEDQFICTLDTLYLHGSLVGDDKKLAWNDNHTIATWSGSLDLTGTKQFTVRKQNRIGGNTYTYDTDFYSEAQTFGGGYSTGTFVLDITKMTAGWYVSLDEETNDFSALDGITTNVFVPREFPANDQWYTLCMPFDMTNEQLKATFGEGYTLAAMSGSEDRGSLIHLNFDYVNALAAGVPYMLMPGEGVDGETAIQSVTIKNVDPAANGICVKSTYMNFIGTFNEITLTAENQMFVGPENYLYSPAEGGTDMGAFRCYFEIPDSSPAPSRPARIVFGGQEVTDIEAVDAEGCKAQKMLKDGVLYIMRDGKLYNAQGLLIK